MGWREDALEFFKKGGLTDELEKLKAYCLETGDAFLLGRLGHQAPEVWRRLGERALALGKLYFARRAFEIAGDDDKTAMVAGLIAGQTPARRQLTMAALDYYRILGVKPTCTLEEVRRRYRLLARQHHPDLNPDDPEAAARFRLMAAAFEAIQAARAQAKAKGRSRRNAGQLSATPVYRQRRTL